MRWEAFWMFNSLQWEQVEDRKTLRNKLWRSSQAFRERSRYNQENTNNLLV